MKAVDMTKIYGSKIYKGNWVAVENFETKPEVVAYAKTLKEAMKKAKGKGFALPLMMQIPKKITYLVGSPQIIK